MTREAKGSISVGQPMNQPHPPIGRCQTSGATACQMTERPLMSGLRPKASAIMWRQKNAAIAVRTPMPANIPTTRRRRCTGTRRCTTRPAMTTRQPTVDRATVADWVNNMTTPHAASQSTVDTRAARVCIYRRIRHTASKSATKARGFLLPGKP